MKGNATLMTKAQALEHAAKHQQGLRRLSRKELEGMRGGVYVYCPVNGGIMSCGGDTLTEAAKKCNDAGAINCATSAAEACE